MQRIPSRRAPSRSVPALALSALLVMTVAARAADEFAITQAQMQGLGITLQRLERPSDIQGQAYPARVVLPPADRKSVV